jgi:hypothetical protein
VLNCSPVEPICCPAGTSDVPGTCAADEAEIGEGLMLRFVEGDVLLVRKTQASQWICSQLGLKYIVDGQAMY